jgi:hypothetical protein
MKAKFVNESLGDVLKPSDLGVYFKDVLQHMNDVGYSATDVSWAFNEFQKDYVMRMFDKGQDSKKTAHTILDYILDGESKKYINEGIKDILKPKAPEDINAIQKYMCDTLNIIFKISGIKQEDDNTEIDKIRKIEDLIHRWSVNRTFMFHSFKDKLDPEDTAKKILANDT